MKIYCVFIETINSGTISQKLESLYTTIEGAVNRVSKLENLGMLNPYFISKPLKGDLVEAITSHYERKLKNEGKLSQKLSLKRIQNRAQDIHKLNEDDIIAYEFEVIKTKEV